MTENAHTPRTVVSGNGTRGPFTLSQSGSPITFAAKSELVLKRYDDADDLVGTLVLSTDYAVSADAVETGDAAATFTLDATEDVLASGESIVVERVTAKSSAFALQSTGGIFEAALDKITRILQELWSGLNRRIEAHPLSSLSSLTLPIPSAGAFIGWNVDADELINLEGVADVAVSSAMTSVVQSSTIDDAMELLDQGDFTATGGSTAASLADRFGSTLSLKHDFGGAGDGVADDTAKIILAAATGKEIDGHGLTYLVTSGITPANYTKWKNCKFKFKLGSGGFSTVSIGSGTRYDTSHAGFNYLSKEGGGFEDCEFFGDGGGEYMCIPLVVRGGMSTTPFIMKGTNRFYNFPAPVTGTFVIASIGAAGLFADTLVFKDVTTAQAANGAYWTGATSVQNTGLSIDDDLVSSAWSQLIRIKRVHGDTIGPTGAAYAAHGPQGDCVTVAGTFDDDTHNRDIFIDVITAREVPEVVDAQGRGSRFGSIVGRNIEASVFKAAHGWRDGFVNRVHGENVGFCIAQIAGSSASANDTDGHIGAVTGYGVGEYVKNSGTLVSATSTTAVLAVGASSVNDYYQNNQGTAVIRLLTGTGAPAEAVITDYVGSTRTVSVASWPSGTPDATTTYEILPYDTRVGVQFLSNGGTREPKNFRIDSIAIQDGGAMQYIVRNNLTGVLNRNSARITQMLGYQLAPVGGASDAMVINGNVEVDLPNSTPPLRKNLLLNGSFQFNQRAPATSADDTYAHDGWYALSQSNPITVQTVSNPENGLAQAARLVQSNATPQRCGYAQIIESKDCIHLRGRPVTLSGRVRLSATADVRFAILEWTGTADAVTSDFINDWTSSTYTANNFFTNTSTTVAGVDETTCTANTWRDLVDDADGVPLTALISSSMTNLVVIIWTEGTVAQNVALDLGSIQLEEGVFASKFERRAFEQELALCQRRYEKSFEVATAPAQNVGAGTGEFTFPATVAAANTNRSPRIMFKVPKRATAPTVTTYSPSAATAEVYDQTASGVCTATATANKTQNGFHVTTTANASTAVGGVLAVHWTAESDL